MTTGYQLDSVSSVTNTSAWKHLMMIDTSTGETIIGDIIIPNGVFIDEEQPILLMQVDDSIEVLQELVTDSSIIEIEDGIIIEIVEEGDIIDGVY